MAPVNAAAEPRLYLIDASGYVYRAFHALPALTTTRGVPTNAVYGFTTMLTKLLREERPPAIAVVFDAPGETFRDELFGDYKANRTPMADELRPQLGYVRRVVEALRLPVIEVPGVEADDVIGTLAAQAGRAGLGTVIVTADKDMMQLVDERTTMLDTVRGRRIGPAEVRERFGVEPLLVPDVLGLMGDSIDNIPGVKGIGEKTAMRLVSQLGAVEQVLTRLDEIEGLGLRGAKRIRESLAAEAETARLSKTLATIRRDVDVTLDLERLHWDGPDPEKVRPLFMELEFASLLAELLPTGVSTPAVEHVVLSTPETVREAAARAETAGALALGAVLGSARATVAEVSQLALAVPAGPVGLLTGPPGPALLGALRDVLGDERVRKVGGDLKALRVALARHGIPAAGRFVDLSLASYCLDPSRGDHSTTTLAVELLGLPAGGDDPGQAACRSAIAALELEPLLASRLESHGMTRLFEELELPLADVLVDMELTGVLLDLDGLRRLGGELSGQCARLLDEIYALAGGPFNVGSPPQLRTVLFERLGLSSRGIRRGKTGLSTDGDVLTKLAAEHPLPGKILEYRGLSKLLSTYVEALPALVDPKTGRLHTSFNQTVAATGRLSSSDPNLQNIPIRTEEGRRIRAAFIAAPGHVIISADYSQVELRLLAHLAEDAGLAAAFLADEDVHARTAADVFGDRPPAEGRRLAKVINYGIVYGMGSVRAARELGVSTAAAAAYIEEYFRRYAGVRQFIDATIAEARGRGWVTTILGRRRYLPELGSRDPAVRQFAERAATNTPIQGSAADLIKLAMITVHRRLREGGFAARLLLQVHDELVLEAPVGEAAAVTQLVRDAMEHVWPLRVPLRVDVRSGANWAEAH
jgi:DNA polymerase-1